MIPAGKYGAELTYALIHELNICLLNAYYLLSFMLCTGPSDETDLIHVFNEFTVLSGGRQEAISTQSDKCSDTGNIRTCEGHVIQSVGFKIGFPQEVMSKV